MIPIHLFGFHLICICLSNLDYTCDPDSNIISEHMRRIQDSCAGLSSMLLCLQFAYSIASSQAPGGPLEYELHGED